MTNGDGQPAGRRDQLGAALRNLVLASAQRRADRNAEAAGAAQAAAGLFAQVGARKAQARALRLAADSLIAAGRGSEALDALVAARHAFGLPAQPDAESPVLATPADEAGCAAAEGAALRLLGRLDEARAQLTAAAECYRAAGLEARAAICRLDLAVVLHALGDVAASISELNALRPVLVRQRRAAAVAVCDFDMGVALHDLGSLDDAIEFLQQARATFASLGRVLDVAACNQNLGVAMQAMGRSEEAAQRLADALAVFERLGRSHDAEQCIHNLAVVARSVGDEAAAGRLEASNRLVDSSPAQ